MEWVSRLRTFDVVLGRIARLMGSNILDINFREQTGSGRGNNTIGRWSMAIHVFRRSTFC